MVIQVQEIKWNYYRFRQSLRFDSLSVEELFSLPPKDTKIYPQKWTILLKTKNISFIVYRRFLILIWHMPKQTKLQLTFLCKIIYGQNIFWVKFLLGNVISSLILYVLSSVKVVTDPKTGKQVEVDIKTGKPVPPEESPINR